MAGTIIDQLTTIFDFKTDTSGIKKADTAMEGFTHKTEKANETLEFFKKGIEVVGIALGLEKIMEWANEWDNAQNKLRSVGITGDELAATMQQLKNIADTSGTSVEAVSELYQQLNATMGEMLGKQNLLIMVDNLNKVFAINATESGAAKAAMMDMAKGLENPTVAWMEIKRAMQDVPGLANIINKHFKALGTTTSEALQGGAFASKDFVKILIDAQDTINKQFAATAVTVPRATAHLINSFMEFFSVLRQNSGATDFIVDGLNGLATVISYVAEFMKKHINTMKAVLISAVILILPYLTGMALSLWALIAPLIPLALAAVALVLVIDDLITYIKGGDSVIGKMIVSLKAWYAEWSKTHPAIKSVVDAISSLISWVSKLVEWFFKSGEATNVFNTMIIIVTASLRLLIASIEFILSIVAELFEALANIGKAAGSFAYDMVQAAILVWSKFVQFRDWLITAFANIAVIIFKPFITLFDNITGLIDKIMNNSIIKSGLKLFGINVGEDKAPKTYGKNDMIFKPSSRVSLAEQQDRVMNSRNLAVPNNFSTHANSSSFTDNSKMTIHVSIPDGTTKEIATRVVTDALNAHKQTYRIGAMNNDSRIAR